MWDCYNQNQSKVFITEDVLLSASKKLFVDITHGVQNIGKQMEGLPFVYLTEFKDHQFRYNLLNLADYGFQTKRMMRYRSPFVVDGVISSIRDKYQAILAVEIAMALIHTFQESHDMCASNLLNMYMSEEQREFLPEVILTAIFSLVIEAEKPFVRQTVFYTILLSSIVEQSKSNDALKKLKVQMEDAFTKHLFRNVQAYDEQNQRRLCDFLAVFLSQIAGKDLGQTEPLLLKLTEGQLQEPQVNFLKQVFAQLCRLCFPKKVWEQLDPKFHCYLPSPDATNQQAESGDDPELQIITDALLAREPTEKLLEVIQNGGVFVQAVLNRTKKSLEHLKTSVERYQPVFEALFQGIEGQKEIIEQVVVVFGTSDYDKCMKVIQKLCQIGLTSNQAVVEWACGSIAQKKDVKSFDEVSLEFDAIEQALQRESSMKWQTVTLYQQKPPRPDDDLDEEGLPRKKKDVKMEVDALAAAGFDGDRPEEHEEVIPEKRHTMSEFNVMFMMRQEEEIQVFSGALMRLDKYSSKNPYMNNFIVHLLRTVETSFIPAGFSQQMVC